MNDGINDQLDRSIIEFFKIKRNKNSSLDSNSSLSDDIFNIIRFSLQSNSPKEFLLKYGIIIFSNVIALCTKRIVDVLICSKTSFNKKLKTEKWNLISTVPQNVRNKIENLTSSRDIKSWQIRSYPESQILARFINDNSQKLVHIIEPIQKQLNQLIDPMPMLSFSNLSLQKDVYSWTYEEID